MDLRKPTEISNKSTITINTLLSCSEDEFNKTVDYIRKIRKNDKSVTLILQNKEVKDGDNNKSGTASFIRDRTGTRAKKRKVTKTA